MIRASDRVLGTDAPIIVEMAELIRGKKNVLSLAQGVVHWSPPESACEATIKVMSDSSIIHGYGAGEGSGELIDALRIKLRQENRIMNSEIMVTAGANQAYVNCVLALANGFGSKQIIFLPYYFNHKMAIQMSDGIPLLLPADPTSLLPDLQALEDTLKNNNIATVTLVNPGNPTGTMLPSDLVHAVADLTKKYNAWLIMDNTYEYFAWDPVNVPHVCVEDDHIINIFSMSKAYGCPGWRIGYIAYPPRIRGQLQKIQDTVLITPTPNFSGICPRRY